MLTIETVLEAQSLAKVDELLTRSMAERKQHEILQGDGLSQVTSLIIELYSHNIEENQLFTASILGRLEAVAKGRAGVIVGAVEQISTNKPVDLETLGDADHKLYAAQFLQHSNAEWVKEWCYEQALRVDTADKVRYALLAANLEREGTLSLWINGISKRAGFLQEIENKKSRIKRIRRILSTCVDVLQGWRGHVGQDFSKSLALLQKALFSFRLPDTESDDLSVAIDSLLAILVRGFEVRYSHALIASNYEVLVQGKRLLGYAVWAKIIRQSNEIQKIREILLETVLVLARQYRTDQELVLAMRSCWTSRTQISTAVKKRFNDIIDVDLDIKNWWINTGEVNERKEFIEHQIGNSEDHQIGALLIERVENSEYVRKLDSAVVPTLEIGNEVLAASVRQAYRRIRAMEQIIDKLSKMRKLRKTDFRGSIIEYNPLEHEMLGGHQGGVRRVKVVRDGVQKEFGGRMKMFVKLQVDPMP